MYKRSAATGLTSTPESPNAAAAAINKNRPTAAQLSALSAAGAATGSAGGGGDAESPSSAKSVISANDKKSEPGGKSATSGGGAGGAAAFAAALDGAKRRSSVETKKPGAAAPAGGASAASGSNAPKTLPVALTADDLYAGNNTSGSDNEQTDSKTGAGGKAGAAGGAGAPPKPKKDMKQIREKLKAKKAGVATLEPPPKFTMYVSLLSSPLPRSRMSLNPLPALFLLFAGPTLRVCTRTGMSCCCIIRLHSLIKKIEPTQMQDWRYNPTNSVHYPSVKIV